MGLQVTPQPIQLHVDPRETVVAYAYGDAIYYGRDATVSPAEHDGTLKDGESATFVRPVWLATHPDVGGGIPGSARLEVTSIPPIVDGPKGRNAALASLVAALDKLGLITDRTS